MNNKIKAKNLETAIKEVCKLSKSEICHIKLIKMENEQIEYYLIRSTLIHWQFWYDPKTKTLEMERI